MKRGRTLNRAYVFGQATSLHALKPVMTHLEPRTHRTRILVVHEQRGISEPRTVDHRGGFHGLLERHRRHRLSPVDEMRCRHGHRDADDTVQRSRRSPEIDAPTMARRRAERSMAARGDRVGQHEPDG